MATTTTDQVGDVSAKIETVAQARAALLKARDRLISAAGQVGASANCGFFDIGCTIDGDAGVFASALSLLESARDLCWHVADGLPDDSAPLDIAVKRDVQVALEQAARSVDAAIAALKSPSLSSYFLDALRDSIAGAASAVSGVVTSTISGAWPVLGIAVVVGLVLYIVARRAT